MPIPFRHWRNLVLVALVAAACFGGSFTCKGSTHDDDNGSGATVDIR
jgi:hypothetical protein